MNKVFDWVTLKYVAFYFLVTLTFGQVILSIIVIFDKKDCYWPKQKAGNKRDAVKDGLHIALKQ
jgi:hypothetical protein